MLKQDFTVLLKVDKITIVGKKEHTEPGQMGNIQREHLLNEWSYEKKNKKLEYSLKLKFLVFLWRKYITLQAWMNLYNLRKYSGLFLVNLCL